MRRQRIADDGTAVIDFPAESSSYRSPLTVEKLLQNGDLYCGGFSNNAPHGRGKYLWADGCMYEGEWRRGKAAGKGKFSWTSGATFEGEFKGGRMEGFGTFIGADGDSYYGSWIADQKHGNGCKSFVNGDFYEGQWRRNLQEGHGRYVWRNGNQFVGEWRGGVIAGRGVLIWENGNRYEGQWENGVPKGSGVFTWGDGSCYIGSWSRDPMSLQQFNLKFYPISITGGRFSMSSVGDGVHPFLKKKRQSVEKNFRRICIWDDDNDAGDITCEIMDGLEASVGCKDGYEFGRGGRNHCCFEGGEGKRLGQTISKGHKNYDLMINLQLGIRYIVGKPGSMQPRELKPSDFDPMEKFWIRFPPEGSKITPPHQSVDFKWKDYCPLVFRHLRKLFEVDPANYMIAICGDEALRELSSPGKSGSLFYLTQDDRFIIKTVKKCEVKVLIKMLPNYYKHVSMYMNSLLTKFYGVHCVKPVGGIKVRFIVIGNLFCSEYRIHRRFDLKGSSHGRTIHKAEGDVDETTTMKDLDLNFVFHIPKSWFNKLIWQIERDCEFLEAEGIMDYSLLVGVHFKDHDDDFSPKITVFAPSEKICIMKEYLRADEPFTAKVDSRSLLVKLGANMPARAEHVFHMNDPDSGQIYQVILYFGIIDILQDYDIGKKLERVYKSLQVDSTSISAVDPRLYSRRFRDFMSRVFVEDD